MQIHLIAMGQRMPAWVNQGVDEFIKRMPPECRIKVVEIPASKRTKSSDLKRLMQQEGEKMLSAIPKGALLVALDVNGKHWSTEELSRHLDDWLQGGRDVAMLIGGPEGLAPECLEKAELRLSLSRMTLPHPLVRIMLSEQLYRAMSILKKHPYHK
ncbi:MAG: 23S rRNA (pseudouridine(1915)-N(3))-methyltransferase RlmH [Thioalkalispiraceae bacterium]|jgi:23S rRNA (pseudouridine1915-N3)-methyltransferase